MADGTICDGFLPLMIWIHLFCRFMRSYWGDAVTGSRFYRKLRKKDPKKEKAIAFGNELDYNYRALISKIAN